MPTCCTAVRTELSNPKSLTLTFDLLNWKLAYQLLLPWGRFTQI